MLRRSAPKSCPGRVGGVQDSEWPWEYRTGLGTPPPRPFHLELGSYWGFAPDGHAKAPGWPRVSPEGELSPVPNGDQGQGGESRQPPLAASVLALDGDRAPGLATGRRSYRSVLSVCFWEAHPLTSCTQAELCTPWVPTNTCGEDARGSPGLAGVGQQRELSHRPVVSPHGSSGQDESWEGVPHQLACEIDALGLMGCAHPG